jgi:hypothetical protein
MLRSRSHGRRALAGSVAQATEVSRLRWLAATVIGSGAKPSTSGPSTLWVTLDFLSCGKR